MGFTGFYQILCRNNHIGGADCYGSPNFNGPEKDICEDTGEEFDNPLWCCSECNEVAVWWNLVDTTDGSYYEDERIDGYVDLKLKTEPDVCTCECGYVHPKSGEVSTYYIPKEGGHIINGGSR